MIRIFKMNEYDTVISPWYGEETNEWYKKEYDYADEDQPIENVEEVNYDDGYWDEIGEQATISYNDFGYNQEKKFKAINSSIFEFVPYANIRYNYLSITEPEILCSIDY